MIVKNSAIHLSTRGFCHAVDITPEVRKKVDETNIKDGTVTVFVVGSTAGITTIEYEPGVVKDLELFPCFMGSASTRTYSRSGLDWKKIVVW